MRSWHRCLANDCRVETLAPRTTRAALTTSCREASCEVLLRAQAAFPHELELLMNSVKSSSCCLSFLSNFSFRYVPQVLGPFWLSPVARQRREPTPLACLLFGCRCRSSCLLASLRPLVTQVHFTVRRQRTCVGFNIFACSSLKCSECSTRAKCGVPDTLTRSR